ncbi:YbjQ family protein [Domibacillus robiginosus]|uniref:YbjQ family protein n=1 Tax=Domibacillus robiginosus TaxID=1071054 RepID=UPI00067C5119|nr:YbjQ family protein [Domibacillus robiginosus]
MILTTTASLEGYRIESYEGIVSSEIVMGANIVRDLMAGVRDVIGGRSGAYEEKLAEARHMATEGIKKQAESLGAEAIVGIRYDIETIGQGMLICVATGTAVRVVCQ